MLKPRYIRRFLIVFGMLIIAWTGAALLDDDQWNKFAIWFVAIIVVQAPCWWLLTNAMGKGATQRRRRN